MRSQFLVALLLSLALALLSSTSASASAAGGGSALGIGAPHALDARHRHGAHAHVDAFARGVHADDDEDECEPEVRAAAHKSKKHRKHKKHGKAHHNKKKKHAHKKHKAHAAGAGEPATNRTITTASDFVHPGVHVSAAQLSFVRAQLALSSSGQLTSGSKEPWASAYKQLLSSSYGSLSYAPHARADVQCGSYSNPNNGCTDERQDAIAAYTHALAYALGGDERRARKAAQIMDAWARALQKHSASNAPLQTAWAGASWAKAGEILAHYWKGPNGWPAGQQAAFKAMLRRAYLPTLAPGSNSNGNWELVMMEAALGISVYLGDVPAYKAALKRFEARVPAYIYLASDGATPRTVPSMNLKSRSAVVGYWQGQDKFVDGLTQETCRDLTHTGYGLASIANAAEIVRLQGRDLFASSSSALGARLGAALALHTRYEAASAGGGGEGVPGWLCGGHISGSLDGVTDVGFNALAFRLGKDLPDVVGKYTRKQWAAQGNGLFIAWQTLTHAKQPY